MQDSAVHSVVQSWGSEQHLTEPLLLNVLRHQGALYLLLFKPRLGH